jgi:hypothetical protein
VGLPDVPVAGLKIADRLSKNGMERLRASFEDTPRILAEDNRLILSKRVRSLFFMPNWAYRNGMLIVPLSGNT